MFTIKGIKLATSCCNIKYKDRDDVLLIKFDNEAEVAALFARSSFTAAPVNWGKENIKKGKALGLIVNSGNANSFTGKEGDKSLQRVVTKISEIFNCKKESIFMSSTGVIGEILEDQKITNQLPSIADNLKENNQENWIKAAKAITTTDLVEKYSSKIAKINNIEVKINGIAKGSGMIAPNMATMLAYIFTDANINYKILQEILTDINSRTFNAITVDSDQSTNDTVMIFATKTVNNKEINDYHSEELDDFKQKLEELMLDLAKKIVRDGEGATKLIEITVQGSKTKESAKNIAFHIANSPLVKTAIAGADPNWGRIVMAIGKSQETIMQEQLQIKIGEFDIVNNGQLALDYNEDNVHNYLKGENIKIEINIGKYNNQFTVWTCDLTEQYIKINKDYRS